MHSISAHSTSTGETEYHAWFAEGSMVRDDYAAGGLRSAVPTGSGGGRCAGGKYGEGSYRSITHCCNRFPEIDLGRNSLGIYSRLIAPDSVVEDGDRIEIYRPLQADPKSVRRKLAREGKSMGKKRRGIVRKTGSKGFPDCGFRRNGGFRLNLETAVGRGAECVMFFAWQGTTTRNSVLLQGVVTQPGGKQGVLRVS